MIQIDNVSFGYRPGSPILKNINLTVHKGECILLCGKSGCGKTTLTKLVNGLIPHFCEESEITGHVTVDGMNVADTEVYKLAQSVGSVFQNPKSQFFNLDSDAELAFGLENAGVCPDTIIQRIQLTTDVLNMEHLRQRNIFTMSGGEKQSIAFGSVYAMNPSIYVLDEPTANLDGDAIERLRQQLVEVKAQGKTVLIAEHRIYFLADILDRAVFLEDGRIQKVYLRSEFLALTNEERIEMGLRTLKYRTLNTNDQPAKKSDLTVTDLCCKINKEVVLENQTLCVKYGEVLGVMGCNGTGKTTLLRCIAGLQKISAGSVEMDGKPISRKARNRLCYLVMQDVNFQLFSDSVFGECELSKDDIDAQQIEEVLSIFDLLSYKDDHPMALSGGQKQRLAIAAGVLCGKKVILFDEPTSGLDYVHMLQVSASIKKLKELGRVIIIVSHDNEFLEIVSDRIIKLNKADRE